METYRSSYFASEEGAGFDFVAISCIYEKDSVLLE